MFQKVLDIFREICSIPHGSGNTELISDFCTDFAARRSLRYIRDKMGNIIIFKGGTSGYETSPAVIIQGHLDMVCVKTAESKIDMNTQGIEILENEDFIWASGTSLGGDDGIAVAYALALLDSDDIPHPPLEVVLTTDEEVGMLGASFLETESLSGKMMINIDSEDETSLLVSCAGGVRADAHIPAEFNEYPADAVKVVLTGLTGGHSGTEIDKGHCNAIIMLCSMLCRCDGIRLASIDGGSADNAIATSCSAIITAENIDELKEKIKLAFDEVKKQCVKNEPKISLTAENVTISRALSKGESAKILSMISEVPNGVISMSGKISGLVETSLNAGIIKTDENEITLCHALRSSVQSQKDLLVKKLHDYYSKLGAKAEFYGNYPAWEYKENSVLQKVFSDAYRETYGKEITITAIHAGLECGIFCSKINNLDCVSMGPDIFDIHTTNERLSKKSAERVWRLLLKVLEKLV